IALPYVLMNTLFDQQWVRLFAFLFAAGTLSLLLASQTSVKAVVRPKIWLAFGTAVAGTSFVLIVLVLARGTSLHGLLGGVVLEPLKHPNVYFLPLHWRPAAGIVALFLLAAAALSARLNLIHNDGFCEGVAWMRVVAVVDFLSV